MLVTPWSPAGAHGLCLAYRCALFSSHSVLRFGNSTWNSRYLASFEKSGRVWVSQSHNSMEPPWVGSDRQWWPASGLMSSSMSSLPMPTLPFTFGPAWPCEHHLGRSPLLQGSLGWKAEWLCFYSWIAVNLGKPGHCDGGWAEEGMGWVESQRFQTPESWPSLRQNSQEEGEDPHCEIHWLCILSGMVWPSAHLQGPQRR